MPVLILFIDEDVRNVPEFESIPSPEMQKSNLAARTSTRE